MSTVLDIPTDSPIGSITCIFDNPSSVMFIFMFIMVFRAMLFRRYFQGFLLQTLTKI